MLANFTISKSRITSRITPVKIIGGQPNFMGEAYNKETIRLMNQLSFNAKIAADGAVSEKL
ncbi:hypothetical protein D3C81_1861640 [compost metagenome]